MKTSAFKVKSAIISRKMPRINGNNQYRGTTIIGLDIGYGAVKGAGPSGVFTFPAYAKHTPRGLEAVGNVGDMDIIITNNKNGESYLVGELAQSLMNESDVASTTDASLYTRYRYNSDEFKIWALTGICVGMIGSPATNEPFLQTGLPVEYKDRDSEMLKDALVGEYDLSIKVGNMDWERFQFSITKDRIDVMEQPKGTLCAIAYKDGEITDLGRSMLTNSTSYVIDDAGFGTEDIFPVEKGYRNEIKTYTDTGMRAVFEATIKELSRTYPVDVKIFEFQKFLENGKITYYDSTDYSVKEIDFEQVLLKKSEEICDKSIKRLLQEYDGLQKFQYLIITGGTGECRYEQIENFLNKFGSLKVLPGNMNTPDLPFCYSNVIGYYMFRYAKLKKAVGA